LSFTIVGAMAGLAGGLYAIFHGFISSHGFISPDAAYWTASGDIIMRSLLGARARRSVAAIGATTFLPMRDVVSSYSEHWLAVIGVTFVCYIMFFQGTYSIVRSFRTSSHALPANAWIAAS
jgi:branched-chain amino acid transport system permease protein